MSPATAPAHSTGSIFQQALGAAFDQLHPELRRRFGFSSRDGIACLGTGRMDRVWRGSRLAAPVLRLGSRSNILFPDRGRDVPFTIANYAYRDGFGRETVTFVRTFQFTRPRRFDATMVASDRRAATVVDFLGTRQHLAVDLGFRVSPQGGLLITSGDQRVSALPGSPRCPAALTGRATVHEWFDDAAGRFRIDVRVTNPVAGPVIGYSGSFTTEYVPVDALGVPAYVRPVRESSRT
jgi:hypothetical protein